ncbi:hypothetical protein G6F56_013563 [Rhizopus delemar]|nr:hypothetical protein G6F56_013563 [Rhizopus delemar]
MLSEKLRGISKEQLRNITNAASTNEQLSTTIVVESLSNETQRGEQNEMTQSLLSSAEEDAMGSFYSTQDSQMLVDLLATDLRLFYPKIK